MFRRKGLLLLLVAFAAAGLVAISNQPVRTVTPTVQIFQQSRVDAARCIAMIQALSSWQALKNKLPPLDGTGASAVLQDDTGHPDAAEARLLLELHREGLTPCRKATLEKASGAPPAFVSLMAQAYAVLDESYLRLVTGEMSWGDYARAFNRWQVETARQVAEADALVRPPSASVPVSDEERRAAEEALQIWVAQQQLLNRQRQLLSAPNQPAARCQYYGLVLKCSMY